MSSKILLITGGNSGIGLGLAKYLLKKDYEVVTVSRSEDSIKRAKKELGKLSNKILFLQGDVSNISDCEKIYSVIEEKYKRLDGLVNNAVYDKIYSLEELTNMERHVMNGIIVSLDKKFADILPEDYQTFLHIAPDLLGGNNNEKE